MVEFKSKIMIKKKNFEKKNPDLNIFVWKQKDFHYNKNVETF